MSVAISPQPIAKSENDGDPCVHPDFCALCRDADQRKARGKRPRYSTPERPIDWSESEHLAFLRHLMANETISLDAAWNEFGRAARERYNAAPKPTVEALMFSLRERGVTALEEADTLRRLSNLSDQQVIEVGDRLLNPEIARPWTTEEIEVLFKVRVK